MRTISAAIQFFGPPWFEKAATAAQEAVQDAS
jgi:hypothetical protein